MPDNEEELKKLRSRFIEGEISEETYKELKSELVGKPLISKGSTSGINPLYVVVVIVAVVAIGGIILFVSQPHNSNTGLISLGDIKGLLAKEDCPFDCCLGSDYKEKSCPQYFECKNNRCEPMDSDGDGLSDTEEVQLGTNPKIADSDADGVSDYKEVKILGTNPNNRNTDADRYDDGQDPNPTTPNSANIEVTILNKSWGWQWLGILQNIREMDPDLILAKPKINLQITNSGTDYTQYVRFDVVFKIVGTEVYRKTESLSRMNIGDKQEVPYEYDYRLSMAPSTLIDVINQKTTDWSIEIQNLSYEKFP